MDGIPHLVAEGTQLIVDHVGVGEDQTARGLGYVIEPEGESGAKRRSAR